jgi:hypothetical protein
MKCNENDEDGGDIIVDWDELSPVTVLHVVLEVVRSLDNESFALSMIFIAAELPPNKRLVAVCGEVTLPSGDR